MLADFLVNVLRRDNQQGEYLHFKVSEVLQIQNLLVAYKERFDKDNFIKNLLLDNLLLVDIYNRAKITVWRFRSSGKKRPEMKDPFCQSAHTFRPRNSEHMI